MKRLHPGLFEDIPWSTEHVLARTIVRAEALGLPVLELPAWYDVDDAQTLQTLVNELLDGKPFQGVGTPTPASWTCGYLRSLMRESGLRERMCARGAEGELAK
jgi:hypothetical protein